ncbi:MAG: YmfQ family protein [Caulobacteraceae bacterium]
MARTAAQYQDALLRMLPPGKAWPRDPASTMGLLALGLADEFARLDQRGLDLIEEADPRTTLELLGDWETTAGLPDPAVAPPVALDHRRAVLHDRLVNLAGQSAADYVALALRFGYPATVTVHTPFAADVSHADDPLYDDLSRFWWELNVTVPIGTVTPLVLLEHAVRRVNQLHTFVTFNYFSV